MSKFDDLLGTLGSYFKLGITGPRLKNSSGTVAVRNSADSADAPLSTSQLTNTSNDIVVGSANALTISRNSSTASALQLVMPPGKSTDGFVLRQKAGTGAGVLELEFASVSGSTNQATVDTTTLAFGSTSPVSMFTLPANAVVNKVRVIVDTAFNGTPSVSIGVSGTTSKYVASTQVDLTQAATTVFEIYPGLPANGSTENLIATYAAGGASAGSARVEVEYAIPS